jgi:hypothetical protein
VAGDRIRSIAAPFFDVELGLALFAGQTPMTLLGVG